MRHSKGVINPEHSLIGYVRARDDIADPCMFFSVALSEDGYMEKSPSNRIAAIRKAKKLSQQQLAERVGSHWITISKLERGKMQLTALWASRLAEALGVPMKEFFTATDELRELPISGRITGGVYVEKFDDPITKNIAQIDDAGIEWLEISGDDLNPYFHHGDAIGVWNVHDEDMRRVVGRVGYIILDNGDELFGFLRRHIRKNVFDVSTIHGDTREAVEVSDFMVLVTFAPITMRM
ncbi:helix-turn-helix domain-containing protein [Xanthobacter autotrophicus]|uniref:helix-turn-helix domain-containing protein n=1 Tax=Xanthobacter autotrophicus TaxID=280 RepID=UPI003728411D